MTKTNEEHTKWLCHQECLLISPFKEPAVTLENCRNPGKLKRAGIQTFGRDIIISVKKRGTQQLFQERKPKRS